MRFCYTKQMLRADTVGNPMLRAISATLSKCVATG